MAVFEFGGSPVMINLTKGGRYGLVDMVGQISETVPEL